MKTHDHVLNESSFIAFIMSAISGFSDVFCFIALQHLFTAHITGNIVLIITYAIDKTPGLVSRALAIPVFIIIASIASFIIESRGVSKFNYRVWLGFEAILFLALMFSGIYLGHMMAVDSITFVIASMLPVTAMAIHNTIMKTYLYRLPPTTVMTGNLTGFVVDITALLIKKNKKNRNVIQNLKKTSWVLAGFIFGGSLSLTYLWINFYAIPFIIILIVIAILSA